MDSLGLIGNLKIWRWTSLLALLLAAMFLSAASSGTVTSDMVTITAYALVFTGTLLAAQSTRFFRNAGLCLVVVWLLLAFIGSFDEAGGIAPVFMLVTGGILVGCLFVTVSELVHNKEAGLDPIMGAVFGYILIGVSWSLLYAQIEINAPGAFNLPSEQKSSSEFIYFSLVTLTSLGYGDITPAAPIARLLAGLQAATGTIYIAVFIGRVVGRFRD